MVVPLLGFESMVNSPPRPSMRWRMPMRAMAALGRFLEVDAETVIAQPYHVGVRFARKLDAHPLCLRMPHDVREPLFNHAETGR